ncbi:MAG: helix-turn-helix transcriptional regulator [Haloferacaceae archaeon]
MSEVDSADVIEVVRRRSDVLGALVANEAEAGDLVDRLDVSQSTIDRGVRDLSRYGLVERGEGGYRLTLAGRLVFEEYRRFRRRLDDVVGNAGVLSSLSRDAPFQAAVLDDATVATADKHAPYRPAAQVADIVDRATHVRAFTPALVPRQVETYRQRIVEDGLSAEFVLTNEVVELLVTSHGDALHEALATGSVKLRRVDDGLPFGLVVAETPDGPEMGMVLYADSTARAFVGNDGTDAVAWARETLGDVWERGVPISFDID